MEDQKRKESCLNCGEVLNGDYCSNCGQSAAVDRISFKDTLADFFSASFALEGPLMHTIGSMIANPGKVFRQFLEGKRKRYYKPVAFFILLTAIYLILRSWLDYNPVDSRMNQMNDPEGVDLNLLRKAGSFMFKHINNFLFLLVLGIALSFKTFYWKRYRLAEYVVIGFYIGGIYILFGTLVMLWNHFTGLTFGSIHLWFVVIYIMLSSMSLFKSRSFIAITKSLLISIFSLVLYMSLAFGISLLIILFK